MKKLIGTVYRSGYIREYATINKKQIFWSQHRRIWEDHFGPIPKGMKIDHINGIRDDNRIENLQMLTNKQNCQRIRHCNVIGYTKKGLKFEAKKKYNFKTYYLGRYGSPGGAKMAYNMFFISKIYNQIKENNLNG